MLKWNFPLHGTNFCKRIDYIKNNLAGEQTKLMTKQDNGICICGKISNYGRGYECQSQDHKRSNKTFQV